MNLVFLYGPPSVGKFTVGTVLARTTGYGLCHNHLTVDVGRAVFGDDETARHDLMVALRHAVAVEAARKGRSVVTTVAYSGAPDDGWLADMVTGVENEGGRMCFVRLWAPVEVLVADRLTAPHRAPMGKPTDPARLFRRAEEKDMFARVPYPGLEVDTTVHQPAETVRLVVDTFRLPTDRKGVT